MNKIDIERKIYNSILQSRQDAEHQADVRYYKALQNAEFAEIDKQIRATIIEKAKTEFDGKNSKKIDEKIKVLKEQRAKILEKMNMTLNDIRPQYACKICNDTGFVGNSRCSCFQNAVSKELFKFSNLSETMRKTFEDFNTNIYDDKKFGEKILLLAKQIVDSKGAYRVPIVLFRGEVGAGKTFLVECISNELLNKNVAVIFMPAFELSQKLLEWHLGTLEEKNVLQQAFIDCDVLVIDDLGTEPIYQNVSIEYLQNIIDIRIMKNKLTIVTTNLLPEAFLERYGDRLGSRLYMSDNALKLEIKNRDLRKK